MEDHPPSAPSSVTACEAATRAVSGIRSGQRVFVHGCAATPHILLDALMRRADELHDVELVHLHTEGPAPWGDLRYRDHFRVVQLFVGPAMRAKHRVGVDFIPCSLSDIPRMFSAGIIPIDVALLHLSLPDAHGNCSFGTSVDVALAAARAATTRIAQLNVQMPRVWGDGFLHRSVLDEVVVVDAPLPEHNPPALSPVARQIGRRIAERIDDGSTLQLGIGAIPDAVMASLGSHRHLGLHSEMWSDGTLSLLEQGVIDNSRKPIHRGKSIAGFVFGTRRVYDYIDDNPAVALLDIRQVNDPIVIAQHPKMVAINSAVEVDLTGQVCADSVGHRVISGVGGQLDFMRGAALSTGGQPIIALPARTRAGRARIVYRLHPGAGVVTPRSDVHTVVTEFGVAELFGQPLETRAQRLIELAHPDDREALAKLWRERFSNEGEPCPPCK